MENHEKNCFELLEHVKLSFCNISCRVVAGYGWYRPMGVCYVGMGDLEGLKYLENHEKMALSCWNT